MSQLPSGWAIASLSDVGTWSSGGTPSRRNPTYFGQGIPWAKSGDLPDGPITQTEEQITELGLQNSSAKVMPTGTISLALYGATIGKLGVMTFPAATNQACANVVPNAQLINPQYLFFYLSSEREALIDKGQGGAQPNISQQIVKAHPIRIAPLNEQRRIVAKLEKLLSRVNRAQERLTTIPLILKRFRQSVLSAVSNGLLIGGVQNASEWKQVLLSEITHELITGPFGSALHKSDYECEGIPVVNPTNLLEGRIVASPGMAVSASTKTRLSRYVLHIDDIVIARRGELGRCALVTQEQTGWLCGTGSLILRLNNLAFPKFIQMVISSPRGRAHLNEGAVGSTMANVNQRVLMDMPLVLPSLHDQREIVRRAEVLFKTADALEARYLKVKEFVDKLTQSILAKAFQGELVPQDPTDEPASVLLERIQQNRNGDKAFKRRTRK